MEGCVITQGFTLRRPFVFRPLARLFWKVCQGDIFFNFLTSVRADVSDETMDREELEELKYRQLQKKAKEAGIKANLPRLQLIQEILDAQYEATKSREPLHQDEGEEDSDQDTNKEVSKQ